MLAAIRQWVIRTLMKSQGETGIVRTLPNKDLVELNTQVTAQRLMQNGVDPQSLKNANQVENAIIAIENKQKANLAENIRGGIKTIKPAKVFDMEGKEIPRGSDIMGGKAVPGTSARDRARKEMKEKFGFTDKRLDEIENTQIDEKMMDDLVKQDDERIIKERLEKQNKEALQRIRMKKAKEYKLNLFKNLDDNKKLNADEMEELGEQLSFNINDPDGPSLYEVYPDFDGTAGSAKKILRQDAEYEQSMFNQYKKEKSKAGKGKFTKAEYLIQRLKNTIKANPDDKYVQENFSNMIKELEANPDLAKNENVFRELGGDLPENQKIKVYDDDTLDFFTLKPTKKFRLNKEKFQKDFNVSDEEVEKILKMSSEEQRDVVDKYINKDFKERIQLSDYDVTDLEPNAEGGRVGFKVGGIDKARRAFLKTLGAVGTGITALKTGLLGFGKKTAPAVKTVKSAGSGQPPAYFFNLVEKIKILGNDVTESYATKERERVTRYKDYELTEDITTGEQTIQKITLDHNVDTPIPTSEEVYMNYKPGKGQADEAAGEVADEYVEDTSYIGISRGNKGEIIDTVDGVPDEVINEVEAGSGNVPESFYTGPNAIKKAEGGIMRIGYKVGGIDLARRAFLKAAAGVGAGIGALKTGLLSIGKSGDAVKNLPPIKTPVTKLEDTTTEMPEWFPSFINKFRDEGKAENVFKKKKVAVSKAEYDQAAAEGKLTEGNYFIDPRTPEYIAKNPNHSLYNKLVDTDERIYTTYTNDKVPGVRVDDMDGNVDVMFENDYSQPVSINYTAPGKRGPETGRVDIFLEGEAKMETKPKGEFVANDVETYATDPDGGFDTEDVIADTLDDMMEGTTRQMEEYATGKKVKGISKGEGRVVEREIRAEQASDAAAEAEAAADAADEFASGGIARMLGE